jgi:glyoxylase-like metal-dependent hydrolase (beta-lactamase superfamily II)
LSWCALVASVSFIISALPLAAQAPPRDPIVREGVTEKIAEHTYVIPDDNVVLVPNVGIIAGSRAMLVIDTGMGNRNGATVLKEARKIRPEGTLYLATTHVHPEHDLGAGAFPRDTIMIRSEDQEKEIAETGLATANLFAGRSPVMADLLKDAKFRQANITFTADHVVDLGGVRVRLIAMGLNHTRGDTAFFVEPDGVLFAGDLAMRAQPGLNQQSTIGHWLETLDRLEALHPARIVPSHGPMGDTAMIANYRSYLQTIQTRVAALKREGKNIEEAAQTIAAELQPRYPDRNRTMAAVRVAYNQP